LEVPVAGHLHDPNSLRRDHDSQLLSKLPAQGRSGRLPFLQLASRKLPFQGERAVSPALADEHPSSSQENPRGHPNQGTSGGRDRVLPHSRPRRSTSGSLRRRSSRTKPRPGSSGVSLTAVPSRFRIKVSPSRATS